jgi:hypothetical protein
MQAERFDNAVRKIFTVSKEAYLKEEARLKKLRDRKSGKEGRLISFLDLLLFEFEPSLRHQIQV